ncbi:MAG: hypothetical protein ABH823_04180 [bacterium]
MTGMIKKGDDNMSLGNLDHKKLYYYVICVMAFFVLMWGAVDLVSSSIGLVQVQSTQAEYTNDKPVSAGDGEQIFDSYYQRKMLQDRLFDSLARIIVSGLIFGYCRFTVNKLEQQA